MSEGSDTVAYVGDLLTFAPRPRFGVIELRSRARPGGHHGLRRGTSATSWYDAGCRLEASDPERAIAAYRRAVAGCPGLADAHNNLGRLLHDAGSPVEAESCYRLAICADPTIALYWSNLGVAVEDQGRRAEAIAAYERAIELGERSETMGGEDLAGLSGGAAGKAPRGIDPVAADAHYNLARLLELAGRRAGDDILLRRAVRHLLRYRDLTRRNASAR